MYKCMYPHIYVPAIAASASTAFRVSSGLSAPRENTYNARDTTYLFGYHLGCIRRQSHGQRLARSYQSTAAIIPTVPTTAPTPVHMKVSPSKSAGLVPGYSTVDRAELTDLLSRNVRQKGELRELPNPPDTPPSRGEQYWGGLS